MVHLLVRGTNSCHTCMFRPNTLKGTAMTQTPSGTKQKILTLKGTTITSVIYFFEKCCCLNLETHASYLEKYIF